MPRRSSNAEPLSATAGAFSILGSPSVLQRLYHVERRGQSVSSMGELGGDANGSVAAFGFLLQTTATLHGHGSGRSDRDLFFRT